MIRETARHEAVTLVVGVGLVGSVLGFVPTAWPAAEIDAFDYPKELIFHLGVLTAAAIAWLASGRRPGWSAVDAALYVFLGWAVASAIVAQPANEWLAWRSVALTASSVIAFWTARHLDARGHGQAIVVAIALATVFGAGAVVLEAQGGPGASLASRAPSGTQGIRNYAGHLIAIGLPMLWLLVYTASSRRQAILAGAGIALASAAVILTRSRAAWLALLAALVIGVVARVVFRRSFERRGVERHVVAVTAVILGMLLAGLVPHRLAWREDEPYLATIRTIAETETGSGHGRLLQYRNSLAMIGDHPLFGVGPGQWHVAYPRYAPPGDPTLHAKSVWNTPARSTGDWIGYAAERGVPGMLALAAFLVLTVAACLRGLRDGRDPPRLLAVLCTCIIAVVVAAFDCALQMAVPSFLVFTALALASPRSDERRVLPRSWRIAGSGLLLAVAGALAVGCGRQVIALRLASSASSNEDWDRVAAISIGQPRIHLWAAWSWGRARQHERALEHATAALRLNPELEIVRNLASSLQHRVGAADGK